MHAYTRDTLCARRAERKEVSNLPSRVKTSSACVWIWKSVVKKKMVMMVVVVVQRQDEMR